MVDDWAGITRPGPNHRQNFVVRRRFPSDDRDRLERSKILDVGCGTGHLAELARRGYDTWGRIIGRLWLRPRQYKQDRYQVATSRRFISRHTRWHRVLGVVRASPGRPGLTEILVVSSGRLRGDHHSQHIVLFLSRSCARSHSFRHPSGDQRWCELFGGKPVPSDIAQS